MSLFTLFRIQDIADIIIMSILVYQLYSWFRNSRALQVMVGIASLGLVYVITKYFGLVMTSWILQEIGTVLFVLIIVIFQAEIRQALYRISLLRNVFGRQEQGPEIDVDEISRAVFSMASSRTGALIVFQRSEILDEYLLHGVPIDARLSSQLLLTLFATGTPLHDGAVVIRDGRVALASCHLPLSANADLPQHLGTRHRAGVGLTERSDAIVLVISEERGEVSLVQAGELQVIRKDKDLAQLLRSLLAPAAPIARRQSFRHLFFSNIWAKGITVFLVMLSWTIIISRQGGITSVAAPVTFHNIPAGTALIGGTPDKVRVKYSSLLLPVSRPDEVAVDLDLSRFKQGENLVVIRPDDLHLPLGAKLITVEPAEIRVVTDRKVEKELRVRVRTVGTPSGGAGFKVRSDPAYVRVEGPRTLLLPLEGVSTEPLDLTGLPLPLRAERRLVPPSPQLRVLGDGTVKIKVTPRGEIQ
jgi:uncharacterized protein (TIGR00159 family)